MDKIMEYLPAIKAAFLKFGVKNIYQTATVVF